MKRIQLNRAILLSVILTNTVSVDASHIGTNIEEATGFNRVTNHSSGSFSGEFCPTKSMVASIPHCRCNEANHLARSMLNVREIEHTISEFEKLLAGNVATARKGE